MKFLKKLFSLKSLIIFMSILIALLLATRFASFSASEEEIEEAFAQTNYSPISHLAEFDEGNLHYITTGDTSKTSLILIHGSPGSWDAWLSLITDTDLLKNYHIVAIDRTGYNKTSLKGKYSVQEQSEFLKPIMENYCDDCIVLGHSYGGGLAMQTGIDYKDKVSAVLSIAGTVSASHQKRKFYNYIIHYSPVKWLLAKDLATSNREMWVLPEELNNMNEQLASYTKKAVIIQGEADVLVDSKSAQYLESKLINAQVKTIMKEDMNHFVIWSDQDLILDALDWIKN